MSSCITNKRVYLSQALAEDALIETRTRFEFRDNTGPVAVYQCENCGGYHLTSQGPTNPRLAAALASGKIKLQKEADLWERRYKVRGTKYKG